MKKTYVRIIASQPKLTAPFAADLVLFTFERIGRTFECEGYRAVTRAQLDAMQPTGNDRTDPALGGWWEVTPTQCARLLKLAREHAPHWRHFKAEAAAP